MRLVLETSIISWLGSDVIFQNQGYDGGTSHIRPVYVFRGHILCILSFPIQLPSKISNISRSDNQLPINPPTCLSSDLSASPPLLLNPKSIPCSRAAALHHLRTETLVTPPALATPTLAHQSVPPACLAAAQETHPSLQPSSPS
jgi:hypothetical protein